MQEIVKLDNYPDIKSMKEANDLINGGVHFAKKGLLIVGWTLSQIRDKSLFEEWGFNIFTDYLKSDKFAYSESQAFNWIKAYDEFKGISLQRLESVGIKKLLQIAVVKNKQEREELIESAPKMNYNEVKEAVKQTKITPETSPSLNIEEEIKLKLIREYELFNNEIQRYSKEITELITKYLIWEEKASKISALTAQRAFLNDALKVFKETIRSLE